MNVEEFESRRAMFDTPKARRDLKIAAAVLEGVRRCGVLGATEAYVGNDLPIYQAIGFKKVYNSECWVRYWE